LPGGKAGGDRKEMRVTVLENVKGKKKKKKQLFDSGDQGGGEGAAPVLTV